MNKQIIPWIIPQDTPVIAPGQLHSPYDDAHAGAAHVVRFGDMYRMVYWGADANGHYRILQAESSVDAPNDWKPLGGPLLGPQEDSQLNCSGPSFPFLLPVTDTHWLLYFVAWGRRPDGKLPNTLGVAISDDAGKSWRYHDTHPMLPQDRPYDREATGSVWVLLEGGRFRLYYTAIGRYFEPPEGATPGHAGPVIPQIGIAYAESDDGIHWTKPLDDWIVKPRGFEVEPYEYICSKPCVIKNESGYTLWVNTFGSAYRVHRLSSTDGIKWTWQRRLGPSGELAHGEDGAFDDHQRSYPTIIEHGEEYRCWFTGNRFGATGMGYAVCNKTQY